MISYCFLGFLLFVSLATGSPLHKKIAKAGSNKAVVSQEVSSPEDKSESKEKNVVDMMENQVYDNAVKILPQKSIPRVPMPQPPGKNWGRRMNEQQWNQHKARLNSKAHDGYKRVMHIRNTINDNRHDRRSMKIRRHMA